MGMSDTPSTPSTTRTCAWGVQSHPPTGTSLSPGPLAGHISKHKTKEKEKPKPTSWQQSLLVAAVSPGNPLLAGEAAAVRTGSLPRPAWPWTPPASWSAGSSARELVGAGLGGDGLTGVPPLFLSVQAVPGPLWRFLAPESRSLMQMA